MSEKKEVWKIPVRAERVLKVVFEEPLDMDDALEAYSLGDFVDILDEETTSEEVHDWAE